VEKIQELEQLAVSLPDNDGLKAPLLRFIVAFHTRSLIQHFVENARRLGHGSHVVAAAAYWAGLKAYSLCCGCADKVAGEALRLPLGGECDRCPYVGHDCLVIIPDE
jgi:hypothetical protein